MINRDNHSDIRFFSLFFLLVMVLFLASCINGNQDNSLFKTYWREYTSGDIETNDLDRLQEIVPFDIVLPDYLPEELSEYHPDFTFSTELKFPGETSVKVFYWTTESHQSINFEEFILTDYVLTDFLEPSPEFPHSIFILNSTQVLEETWIEPVSVGSQEQQTVFTYQWINNSIYFVLYVYGYSQDEARKVAESMIK